jgi:FHA domain
MSRPCPYCGTDSRPGFARCPTCGFDLAGHDEEGDMPQGAGQPGDSGPAGAEWGKTVMEPSAPAPDANRRARFDRGREFYEAVNDMPPAPDSDRTIIERRVLDVPDDATVIIRSGRRGATGPLAYLVERSGVRAGKVHLLKAETSIGRGADNDVTLADESVSRRHAKIILGDGKFTYWDLASANFSFLVAADGSRTRILEPRELADGDTIDLGDVRVVFLVVDAGEATDAS